MNRATMRQSDSRDFVIGILSTTAVILLVGILLVQSRPPRALADGMTAAAGPYLLTIGRTNMPDEEYLYVLDSPAQRLIVYRFDATRSQIEIVQGLELAELRQGASQPANPPSRGRGRGRRP